MIGAVLHLPSFSSYSNLPLCLVNILHSNSSEEEKEAFASAYRQQSTISASLSRATSQDIIKLDHPISSPLLNGSSLRRLILQMKTDTGQPIFMSINCNRNGSGHVFSFPTLYRWEAQHRVSYLSKYLAEEYSPCIYAYFTTATVIIAESMEWDATLKKPISATETLHQDIENITFSWEILDYSSLSTPASWPLVNLDKLTVSSQDNPAPVQPPLSTAVPTPALTPLIQDSPPVATTGSTRLLAQQLQAQVLAMSGTSPDKDTLMGTSMPTKVLLRILQSQVNSLLATRTHKPPVASFPQTPPEASLP